MADIAHTIPTSVAYLEGANFGFERPGLQVVAYPAAPHRSRDWLGYNLRAYDLQPALMASSTDTLEEWEAFWHHIDGGGAVGYIVETISGTHRNLVCGGLADGTQTTFPVPALAPSSAMYFLDGSPKLASYSEHSAANILTDDKYADPQTITDFTISNTSAESISTGVACDGMTSIRAKSDGLGTSVAVYPATAAAGACVVGDDYTAIAAILETKGSPRDFRIGLRYYDSTPAYLSIQWATAAAATTGEWVVYTVTNTAPASAAYVMPIVQEVDNTDANIFFVDCLGIAYGDYDRWHLPSVAPGLVEFNSAPASGTRVTATATGQRVTRCRFEPGTSWALSSPGHAAVRSIRAIEDIEV